MPAAAVHDLTLSIFAKNICEKFSASRPRTGNTVSYNKNKKLIRR